MKLIICIVFMFVTFQSFSQMVVNITWINTDRPLLGVLKQKLVLNTLIKAGQLVIHEALDEIRDSKMDIRRKEYEVNNHDSSLRGAVGINSAINGALMGGLVIPVGLNTAIKDVFVTAPELPSSPFPFYNTLAKNEYFTRELFINMLIGSEIVLQRNTNIRNSNTQELHSLNVKMLTKLKKTNKNVHENAVFVIVASLIAGAATMSDSDLNTILSLGL